MLCPKCAEFNNAFTTVISSSEAGQTSISSKRESILVFPHPGTIESMLDSSHAGCHLCTILWQELEIEKYDQSGLQYLKSKLQNSDRSKGFTTSVVRSHKPSQGSKFFYHLEVYDANQSRVCVLGLDIAGKDLSNRRSPSLVSKACRTDSIHHMRLLKQWLCECLSSHESCKLRIASSSDMPKRLLDLSLVNVDGTIRLIEPQKQQVTRNDYAALSYCWGQSECYKLTKSTMPVLLRGLPVSALPRTVQDAVWTAVAVEIPYLWVDALCIQQDSIVDWKEQAKSMMTVYSNSILTIAGAGASSCEDGLFGVRDPLIYLPCPLFDIGNEHQLSTSVSFSPLISWYNFAALYGRGWVVQERLLAPRTINFGVCAVWECRTTTISDITTKDVDVGQTDIRKRFAELINFQDDSEHRRRKLMKLWYIVLAQYTGSALSHKSDRLTAINGIMSSFRKQGYTPWLGLWKPLSIWELMWTVPIAYYNDAAKERGPDINDFPTWSWARHNLDVNYELLPYQAPYNDVVYTADLSGNKTCDCMDHEFGCERRSLSIKALLVTLDIRPSTTQFQKLSRVARLLKTGVTDDASNIVWEDGRTVESVDNHEMVILVVRKPPDREYRCAGLLIEASKSGTSEFHRTGVADFPISAELFRIVQMMPEVDVTLT